MLLFNITRPLVRSRNIVRWTTFHAIVVIISLLVFNFINETVAYGTLTPTTNAYRIVGIPGTGTQSIPHLYVERFTRWKLAEECITINPQTTNDSCKSGMLLKDQYPSDQRKIIISEPHITTIKVRPTIHFLIKSGIPAYAFAGVQIGSIGSSSSSDDDNDDDDDLSVLLLLAQQWTTFALLTEPNMRLVLYLGRSDGTDDRLVLADAAQVRQYVETLGLVLSLQNNDSSMNDDTLQSGFHLISIPLNDEWFPIETVQIQDLSLTCVLTGERDAREVFTLEQDLIEMTATSLLQIKLNDYCEIQSQ